MQHFHRSIGLQFRNHGSYLFDIHFIKVFARIILIKILKDLREHPRRTHVVKLLSFLYRQLRYDLCYIILMIVLESDELYLWRIITSYDVNDLLCIVRLLIRS